MKTEPFVASDYSGQVDPNDPFAIHEVLHGLFMIQTLHNEFVREHGVVLTRPDLAAMAEAIAESLCDLYQAIGQLEQS